MTAAADRAREVRDAVGEPDDELETLLDSTEENAEEVTDELEDATFGEFDVVSTAFDFNYSWKLYAARRARAELDDENPVAEPLDGLVEALRLFGPAREHFKTLYFQSELVAALPSLVVTVAALAFVDVPKLSGAVLGVPASALFMSAVVAVAVAPFVLLLAYVLRIATVTGRTLSIGPFILRRTDRSTDE